MQILGLLKDVVIDFLVDLVAGIYRLVARVYDLMLQFVADTNYLYGESLLDFAQTCYILAGIFMLFRVVISMIQMIINPDLVGDKSAGAGKLVARVVVSIILLIVLSPQGILFDPNTGLLPRIQSALLNDKDGIIYNLINSSVEDEKKPSSPSEMIAEDVYAADSYTCYYYQINENTRGTDGVSVNSIDKFYRIEFRKGAKSGFDKIKNSNNWYFRSLNSNYTVGGKDNPRKDRNGNPMKYSEIKKITVNDKNETNTGENRHNYGKNTSFSTCPAAIVFPDNYAMKTKVKSEASVGSQYPSQFYSGGLYGGTTSLNTLFEDANRVMKAHEVTQGVIWDTISADISTPSENENPDDDKTSYLKGVRPVSIRFSQNVASCFQECTIEKPKCDSIQEKMFKDKAGDDELGEAMKDKEIDFSWIMAMLVGLALIVYLLILCVDVIVRHFKLILLQILAPIPAISYVDPKDKVFNQWLKYYTATYLDLFIKLIAIAFAIGLLNEVMKMITPDLKTFFYIVAILVFAKIVPSMVSKIFGLDGLGGSFKDIMGMAKGAAGFGAGAALTAGAGLITMGAAAASAAKDPRNSTKLSKFGAAASAFTRAAGAGIAGTIRGAGAGAKGNIFAGASNVLAAGKTQRETDASGSTFGGRVTSKMSQMFNFDTPYQKAKGSYEASDAFIKNVDHSNSEALKVAKKAAGNGSQIKEMLDLKEAQDAVAAYKIGGSTWSSFTASHSSFSGLGETELESRLSKAEKTATTKVQADALHATRSGVKMDTLGYVSVDANDTIKIGTQVENLLSEANLLGETFEIAEDPHGGAKFVDGNALKDAKAAIEQTKTKAQGDMIKYKADDDATQRQQK